MEKIRKFISNKNVSSSYKNYCAIIGGAPSKGARSPKLWNKAFKRYKIKNNMTVFSSVPSLDNSCIFRVWMKNSLYQKKINNYKDEHK